MAGARARWLAVAVAAAGVVGLVAAVLPAGAAPPDTGSPPDTGERHAVVTLPTGDRLVVRLDAGGRVRSAYPADRTRTTYLTESFAGETYVVPTGALPKLDSGAWSMARFDVSALVAGRRGVEPGATPQDDATHTVTLNVTDPAGEPATGADLTVVNVDDTAKYAGDVIATDGRATISVPDGHYSVLAFYATNAGHWIDFVDFTVDGADATATVTLADATHRVSVSTPRPAEKQLYDVVWDRGSSDRFGDNSEWILSTNRHLPTYLSTSPDGPGVQHFYVHATLTSPAAASPYLYDVEFPSDGPVGADQSYTATTGGLATVDAKYYSDMPDRPAYSMWDAGLPWETVDFRIGLPMVEPLHRTEYVSAIPGLAYEEYVEPYLTDTEDSGWEYSGPRILEPGEKLSADWLRGPIVPGIPAYHAGTDYYDCGACRADDTLSIDLSPVTDSTPDHQGSLGDETSHLQLYQGDTELVDKKNATGAQVAVPADDETYELVYDQTRSADWTSQSTGSHTVWTFDSAHSGSTTVPAGWSCTPTRRHCSPVSLLLPHYELAEELDGSEAPGSTGSLTLTVGHAPGAARVPVDDATVSVSFDGGTTWTDATVKGLGDNRFQARWSNPDSGMVSFRVEAADEAGNTVSQTVYDGLAIGS
jgi:hypothetical protein